MKTQAEKIMEKSLLQARNLMIENLIKECRTSDQSQVDGVMSYYFEDDSVVCVTSDDHIVLRRRI